MTVPPPQANTSLSMSEDQIALIKRTQRPNKLRGLTREELERLYWDEQLSQWQIAHLLGVTQGAILQRMKRWGIPSRSHDDALITLGKSGRFSGANNPRWNGGRHINPGGYWMVRMPEHHRAKSRGYVLEHILAWEQANDKQLPRGWQVHHKNGDKLDNRPENLEAMTHQKHRQVIPNLLKRIAALEEEVRRLKGE